MTDALVCQVGQDSILRRVSNPPRRNWTCARPRESLRFSRKSRTHGIVFDVAPYPLELPGIAHYPVVTFILPKRQPGKIQQCIRLTRREALESVSNSRKLHVRCNQQVNVVWHNDVRMEIVVMHMVSRVMQCVHDEPCDIRLTQIGNAGLRMVEDLIHGGEGLSGRQCFGKHSALWEATRKSPSQKDGPGARVDMWEVAAVGSHETKYFCAPKILPTFAPQRPKDVVGQDCILRRVSNPPVKTRLQTRRRLKSHPTH
jgi:hypothetical protein